MRLPVLGSLASVATACALAGCGAEPPPPAPAPAPTVAMSSGTPLETLFPLVDRNQYHYATESDDGRGMLIARVRRNRPDGGALQMPAGSKRFTYKPEGIILEREGMMPVYVLKQPVQLGNKWRGEHGGWVEIAEVDSSVEVPSGTYTGCVKTLEERGGDQPLRVVTTFCPDVGIVQLDAVSGGQFERAVLESYGPPVDLGPDGVSRIP